MENSAAITETVSSGIVRFCTAKSAKHPSPKKVQLFFAFIPVKME
jgi:hypothetical protein